MCNKINWLAIEILNKLGNQQPSSEQIDLIDDLLNNITMSRRIILHNGLTKQEMSCLYWAARGKSARETAKILAVQPTTVEFYRSEIKRKLNCKNIAQAIFEGIRFGYLQGQDE